MNVESQPDTGSQRWSHVVPRASGMSRATTMMRMLPGSRPDASMRRFISCSSARTASSKYTTWPPVSGRPSTFAWPKKPCGLSTTMSVTFGMRARKRSSMLASGACMMSSSMPTISLMLPTSRPHPHPNPSCAICDETSDSGVASSNSLSTRCAPVSAALSWRLLPMRSRTIMLSLHLAPLVARSFSDESHATSWSWPASRESLRKNSEHRCLFRNNTPWPMLFAFVIIGKLRLNGSMLIVGTSNGLSV
mmetsp:Transcript_5764/g.17596  ORF Transcript_5764/g.17596 Transcript_5764/m.17596 type:complete len:249 (+) Transcript_5764:1811-2557(+)